MNVLAGGVEVGVDVGVFVLVAVGLAEGVEVGKAPANSIETPTTLAV